MRFEVFPEQEEIDGGMTTLFFWRLVASNGRLIAECPAEGYANRQNARRAVLQLKRGLSKAFADRQELPVISVDAAPDEESEEAS